MSTGEASSEKTDDLEIRHAELCAADFVSRIEGWTYVHKYRVDHRIVEVELMVAKKETPSLDLSAGWNMVEDFGTHVLIQRLLK